MTRIFLKSRGFLAPIENCPPWVSFQSAATPPPQQELSVWGTEPESVARGSLSNLALQGDMFGNASSSMLDIWLCARVSLDNIHNKLPSALQKIGAPHPGMH